MSTNNIMSFDSSNEPEPPLLNNSVLASCRPIIEDLSPGFFTFITVLDDALYNLADKATSNQEQGEYFFAMRQFRVNQDNLKKEFTQLILKEFDDFASSRTSTKNKYTKKKSTSSELSLLDNESLEEEIAVERVTAKCEALFSYNMQNLDLRFAKALGIEELNNSTPLSPDNIVRIINNLITPLSSNIATKIVVFKQFGQSAVSQLGTLYSQLNKNLIGHGILPNLEQKKIKRKDNGPASPKTTADSPAAEPITPVYSFDDLRQHLNKPQNDQSSHSSSALPIANNTTVLTALSEIQQQSTAQISFDSDGIMQLPDIRQVLMANLQVTQQDGVQVQQAISRLDEDAMDLIDLLFEFILNDQTIPAPIRAMLARLQIPLLKIALNDKTVFSEKTHPARKLLNNLAQSAAGWSEAENNQQDQLQLKIESIIDTILLEFDADTQLFISLDAQFNDFIAKLNKSSKAAEQRIVKANEGKEKLLEAQQEVDEVINQQLMQYEYLPRVVLTLIEDAWKHVLVLRLLQKGKDSEEWKSAVELVQQLIWSVHSKSEDSDRKKLLAIIPTMLKSIREGLSGASFNQHKITSLFKDLQQCHIQCMRGNYLPEDDLQEINKQALIPAALDLETLPSLEEDKKVISNEEALQKAKQLAIGTWLEIASDDDTPKRIKFSWRSNLTGKCLFVTYQGTKAAEFSITELASWFQQGKILIVDQSTQLMDRALTSMMDTVNS